MHEGYAHHRISFVHVTKTKCGPRECTDTHCPSGRVARARHKLLRPHLLQVPEWPARTAPAVLPDVRTSARVAARRSPLPMRVRKLSPQRSEFRADVQNIHAPTSRRICLRAPHVRQQVKGASDLALARQALHSKPCDKAGPGGSSAAPHQVAASGAAAVANVPLSISDAPLPQPEGSCTPLHSTVEALVEQTQAGR